MHTTNNDELCTSVIKTADISCLICTMDRISIQNDENNENFHFSAKNVLKNCKSVKYLLILDDILSNDLVEEFPTCKLYSLVEIISENKYKEIQLPNPSNFSHEELSTILFTSGSSVSKKACK